MSKINIAFDWPQNIETAWSGTAYSILCELKKNHDVNIIDLKINFFQKLIIKILNFFKLRWLAIIFELKSNRKIIINKKISGSIFQFSTNYFSTKDITFCYIDCSYRYLYELRKENKNLYKSSGFRFNIIDLKILAKYQDNCFKKMTNIFVMSKNLYNFFDKHYEKIFMKKVIHVGGGINIDKNRIEIKEKEKSFLFVGKDYKRKSCELVIDAFNTISKNDASIKLYIIGPRKKLFDYNNKNIIQLGEQPFSVVQDYMNRSKVFVMPSKFEAYGLAFIEALVSGCIIIGTDEFEMKYFINRENGYTTKLNIEDLSKKMKLAINNDELTNKIIFNKEKYLKKYSWDSVVKRMGL